MQAPHPKQLGHTRPDTEAPHLKKLVSFVFAIRLSLLFAFVVICGTVNHAESQEYGRMEITAVKGSRLCG